MKTQHSENKYHHHMKEPDAHWEKVIGDAFEGPLRERISLLKPALQESTESNLCDGILDVQPRGEATIVVTERYGPFENLIRFIQRQQQTTFVEAAKWALDFIEENPAEDENDDE